MINLFYGDCLDILLNLSSQSIDMILADPPYGSTKCKWDVVIPLEPMWEQLNRIIKPNGAIVLTAGQPYTSMLIMSNKKMFRYCWVWQKTLPTGHLNAKKMPMKAHEDIVVFYEKLPTYNPQKTFGHERKVSTAVHKRNSKMTLIYGEHKLTTYDSTERYPITVQVFKSDRQKQTLHPTQKPVALMEYLVKTYTNEGDIVLDFAMGSGTTGVAAKSLKRKFIGIELNKEYFEIAKGRIRNVQL